MDIHQNARLTPRGREALAKTVLFEGVTLNSAGCPTHSWFLSSLMTCFTKCPGTSFTLLRERSERGGVSQDAVEDYGCSPTEGGVCSGGEAPSEVVYGPMSGVWYIASHRMFVGAALSATGSGRHRRTQPTAGEQSATDGSGNGRQSSGVAQALSGLGCAQAWHAVAGRRGGPDAQHHSPHLGAA